MENNSPKQEVVVTDVRMRFGSMVVFMVKWAIASIPAIMIIVFIIVGLTCFLRVFVIGIFEPSKMPFSKQSITPPKVQTESSNISSTDSSNQSNSLIKDETEYLSKIVVRKVEVGSTEFDKPGVFGEIKNTGEKTLKEVEITIFCLDKDSKPIFEKTSYPVLVTELGMVGDNQPLKPGYSKPFGVRLSDAPSDWEKKVDIKVTKVSFQ